MADLKDILRVDDKVLEFLRDIDVIKALETLVQTFEEKRAELADFRISDVFQFIDSIENNQSFFDALSDLGLDGDDLRARVTSVSEALGNISEEQRRLLQPLSNFDEDGATRDPGLVNWNILDAGKAGQSSAVGFSFDLGAAASLVFEAGDTWPQSDPGMPDPLLRLGLSGNFRAKASASVPINLGAVSASTDNTANAALNYYFDPQDHGDLYAAAIGSRLGDLCNPVSLDSVWRSVAASDMRGIVARFDGSTSLKLDVSVAEGFTIADELAQVGVDLKVGAKVKRTGEYELIIRAVPATASSSQRLEVTLSRSSLLERGHRLSLGVVIDLAELAKRLRLILERHLHAFTDVIEQYKDYLTPGTYVRDELSEALNKRVKALTKDADLKKVLGEAIDASLGNSDGELPSLDKFLSDEITGRLDELGEVITGRANLVAKEVVKRIAEKVEIDPTEALGSLETKVEELVEELRGDLEKKVRSEFASSKQKLKKALDKAGVRVSGAVSTADDALEGVREVIGKYEGLLKKLIAHTEDAARTKITARLTHEETRTSGKVIDVRMTVSNNTPAANDAFRTLVRGDMDGIVELLGTTVPGIEFDRENMSLTRFASLNQKTGFEVVLLGFEFRSQSIFDADAHVTSDGSGRVSVTSSGTWTKRKENKKEQRELQFVDAFELAAARETRQLNIDLSIKHQDEALRAGEFRAFLMSFEGAELLPTGTTDEAVKVLNKWIGPGDDKEIKADVNLGLNLGEKASMRILQLSERRSGNLTETRRRQLFQIALRELRDSGAYDVERQQKLATAVLEHQGELGQSTVLDTMYDYTRQQHDKIAGPSFTAMKVSRGEWEVLGDALSLHELCMSFVDFIELMGDIFEAKPSFDGSDGWTEGEYVRRQKELNKHVRRWFRIRTEWIFWISDRAHPRSVGFIGALIAAAGAGSGQTPALTLSLVRRDGTDDRVTLT